MERDPAIGGRRAEAAGDVDYELRGHGYATHRRSDSRIEALVHRALGPCRSVINVGAGAGSYEPDGCFVLAVEPSAAMRAQRPAHRVPAIDAVAEQLPVDDASFDAAMAMVTVHQWADLDRGLKELRRVSRGPVVVLTFDPDALEKFWLADYAPELIEAERRRYPRIEEITQLLGGRSEITTVPVPIDCTDGFTEAFYARPERFLEPAVRRAQSAWGFVDEVAERRSIDRLRDDLHSGAWDERYGHWRSMPTFDGSLRLVASRPS
jgi:SAM-dependent methyltransferase